MIIHTPAKYYHSILQVYVLDWRTVSPFALTEYQLLVPFFSASLISDLVLPHIFTLLEKVVPNAMFDIVESQL